MTRNSTIKKIGVASILLWAILFFSVLMFKTVPSFSYMHAKATFSILGMFAHADEGGSDGGGSDGGAGGGSDSGGGSNGGSDGGGTQQAGAGGGCGDCGGSPAGPADTGTGTAVGSDGGGTPALVYVPLQPNPVCPTGTTGTYPNCVTPPPPVCPAGTTGTYPNCVTPPPPVCPVGTTGTYPNCVTPPPPVCPIGTTGTYPNCVTPPPPIVWTPYCTGGNDVNGHMWQWWEHDDQTPTHYRFVRNGDGVCVPPPNPVCPSGTTGTYPNCVVPTPVCPSGTSGTYPVCVAPSPVCPSGTWGTYPNCVVPTPVCPAGMTGTYPNCIVPYIPPPTYVYPMCTITVSNSSVSYGQAISVAWTTRDTNAGWIENIGSVSLYGSQQMTPAYSTTYVGHFTGTNGQQVTCSANVVVNRSVVLPPPPVYYPPVARVPFITLSQVPYTGLDLGTIGTTLYWGLLAVWLAFMTYMMVAKKLHHDLASYLDRTWFAA